MLADFEVGPARLTDVVLRTTTWDGGGMGLGVATVVMKPLTLDTAGHRVKVALVSSHDILTSGGKYSDGDYKIGPWTPAFPGGGRDPSFLEPAAGDGLPREVHVIMNGPGIDNAVCKIIDVSTELTFRYMMTVRRTNSEG